MSEARYESFEAVRGQPPAEVRRLLHHGDAMERAWAGWTLALRMGIKANPELAAAAHESPTPGVRTLLLVILAGHGRLDLVRAFAADDPDDEVRAAACRYLAMNSPVHDKRAGRFLAHRMAQDTSSLVRAEILRLILANRIELVETLVEGTVSDPDREVRELAAETLLALSLPSGSFPRVLEQRAFREPDDELRGRLQAAWIARGGVKRIVEELAAVPCLEPALAAEVLSAAAATGERFGWAGLARYRKMAAPAVDAQVVALLDSFDTPEAFRWFLTLLDAGTGAPGAGPREAWWAARSRLPEAVAGAAAEKLLPEDRESLKHIAAEWEMGLEAAVEMALEDEGVDVRGLPPAEQPSWYRDNLTLIERLRQLASATR